MTGDNKRKGQWKGGQDGAKRHKGQLNQAITAKGHKGVLVTCDKTKERQAVKDALNILNEMADKYFPPADKADSDANEDKAEETGGSSDTIQKKLQEEIDALKSAAKDGKTGRFTPLDTGVKGLLLVQFKDESLSPVVLVKKIFEEVEATKEFASRFINRIIPLEKIAYSGMDEIKESMLPLLEEHKKLFATPEKPLVYAVEIKRRNCTNLNTMDVINALAEMVGPEHKVNLSAPESVLLVEIFRNTCGVSIVTDFHKFKKFNVRSVIDPPVSEKPAEKKAKDESAKADAESN
ncbi:TPA: hypothetical protein N0F65_003966 [Lagenidium giganteum]|uniref:THUMP domain-containing protein n=1 Tax=Lagenidium giganteum TaxID=4803 RepID=A0AAV2YW71_9STRA|nr:TPA: hypothetical protein N0F65_003966 [Lagenidium giganteum]